ncbi:MAG: hypothetical protein ACK2T7_14385, partial [Anaerolineales bacterium]
LLPWMVYAKITFGYIPIFNKLKFILNTRILEVWRFSNPVVTKLSLFIGGGILLNRPTFWDTLHLQAAHFANNLIKSILIFPTTLRLTSIEEVLRQPYWDESILWDGAVEPLFYLNLAILLLGMAALVRARGKITLVPLVISLAYNLSTALATTSGGRYLKPAIWVFILYYLAGLYYLLDLLLSAAQFTPSTESLSTPAPEQQKRSSNPGRWFWAASAAMLFIGLLVPTVDAAIPQKYDQLSKQETVGLIPGDALASLGADQEAINRLITDKDLRVYYGDGLYPRRVIDDKYFDYFAFSIVGPYHAMEARYYGSWDGIQDFANNSPVIALGCNAQIEDDEFANIILIYLPDQQAVYSVGIDWQTFCPVSP